MKRTRTKINQPQFPLRRLLESEVTAMNRHLKPYVRSMPLEILLNNCPVTEVYEHARKLKNEGHISEELYSKYKKHRTSIFRYD